jgi:hypothetical protein
VAVTEDEWNSPITLRLGEWRALQDLNEQQRNRIAALEADVASLEHDLTRAIETQTELLNETR